MQQSSSARERFERGKIMRARRAHLLCAGWNTVHLARLRHVGLVDTPTSNHAAACRAKHVTEDLPSGPSLSRHPLRWS